MGPSQIDRRRALATLGLTGGGILAGGAVARAATGAAGARHASSGGPSGGPATGEWTTVSYEPRPGQVGEPPDPGRPVGEDQLPQIEHIVVVMMENHSFDNILGMLGRGDGFRLDRHGRPTNSNPNGHGGRLRAFHMPTPCQLHGQPSQAWDASHEQLANGTNQGFVTSPSGPVAMGYWTPADMPFTNSLARVFPLADRWFCSMLGQTYPNRRYLLAGTSLGQVSDTVDFSKPPNGTILRAFNRHGIRWRAYTPKANPLSALYVWPELLNDKWVADRVSDIGRFVADARHGHLPQVSFVDPNFVKSSEENPQDIQFGDAFLATIVNAVMRSPKWMSTLLVWTYDEHGGYYDHVVPPKAPAPDDVPPKLGKGDFKAGFDQFGFRVPGGLVSPYAKAHHVSHTVYDHTSILKLIETKWNLPALTRRDAAANDLLDMVDFAAPPAFAKPPHLAAPADPARRAGCLVTGPGPIP